LAIETDNIDLPVVKERAEFDQNSGGRLERAIFNHRGWVVAVCVLLTVLLGWRATLLDVNTNFDQMIPQSHPYIRNYFDHRDSLKSLGNSVRVVMTTERGTIFDPEYLDVVKDATDSIYLTPGVDVSMMRSVWMPIVRWTEVTEEGYRGGPVMPFDYDGSPEAVQTFRENVMKSGIIGDLVGSDFKSTMIVVPLLEKLPNTGQPLDYHAFAGFLEHGVRQFVQALPAGAETGPYQVHIVGFAKLVGDLIDGLAWIVLFFIASGVIATILIYLYTRDWRSTLLLIVTGVLGVVWLLGLLQLFGYDLNPYSTLVPFLVFAIGVSHGAQRMNGVMQDIGRGTHHYVAARYTFRRLFVAGLTALLANVVGFAVLMMIDVPAIRELALATSIGVSVLIFTKLCFIPVALSYIGVSRRAAERSLAKGASRGGLSTLWMWLERCGERRYATALVLGSLAVGVVSMAISLAHLKIGDLDAGAPELRPDSRYNLDVAYINTHYGLSSDQFAVIFKTGADGMLEYESLVVQDRLAWRLRQLPEVQMTASLSGGMRNMSYGLNEGNPKWLSIPRNTSLISLAFRQIAVDGPGLANADASIAPLVAYLSDHRADTLSTLVNEVEDFARQYSVDERQILLAAGPSGIEAATNIVVRSAHYRMLAVVYLSVIVLCFITFGSWRAVLVALIPLVITSFLCEALMVGLGIGIKVATLPVIALGVGVGVDYALYLLSVQLREQRQGASLGQAYGTALRFTGKVVALIGVTMAAGVVTWAWSPIKFQADMGLLLAFMFAWNMVGALVLIPALSYFLLPTAKLVHAPGSGGEHLAIVQRDIHDGQ